MDIKDFANTLKETFKTNGHQAMFTTLIVQPSKKNLSANSAGVDKDSKEEDPEKKKEYLAKFNETKVIHKVDTAFKRGAIEVLSKLCNESNKSTQEFKDYCKQKNKQGCYHCLSINCLAKQRASTAVKVKRVFEKKCPKKQLTLGGVKALADKAPTSNGSTAAVIVPNTVETNVELIHEANAAAIYDMIEEAHSGMIEESHSVFGHNNMAEITGIPTITEEKLKTRKQYWSSSDEKAMLPDKVCIICKKKNMSCKRYHTHLDDCHSLLMFEDRGDYLDLDALERWNEEMEENPPSPHPRDYDSEKGRPISDNDSQTDEDSDE